MLVFVVERADGAAFAAERMLNRLTNGPAALSWRRVPLFVWSLDQVTPELTAAWGQVFELTNLQKLRDDGFIQFLEKGHYRRTR